MHMAPVSNADEILTSLDSVYRDIGEVAGINPTVDDELKDADLEGIRGVTEILTVDDDTHRLDSVDDLSKEKIHDLMMEDPWILGNKKFAEKDILHVRAKAVCHRAKKARIFRCILNGIHELATRVSSIFVGNKQPIP